MRRVDRYFLSPGLPEELDRFACKLVEKAFSQKYTIVVRTRDKDHSETLDRLLWTFRDRSFIPHDQNPETNSPVLILHEPSAEISPRYRLLVQIGPMSGIYDDTGYERIVDIMNERCRTDPEQLERWQRYQAGGYEMHEHAQLSAH